MAKPGVALVGTGFIGPVHAEALRRLGIPIVGVLGSSPDKARALATQLGARAYASYEELLADPNVQSVHVTSPNRHHYQQCRLALDAGKHVVCEKPLAMNVKESSELVALAEHLPLVNAVCYNIRYYPLCLEIKERIAAGELGDIYHVTGSYVQDWLLHDTDFNWRVLSDAGGTLRAIADIGTHWLDLVQSLMGQTVTEVCADLQTALPTRRRPRGSVETFQSKLGHGQDTEPVAIDTDDYGGVLFHCSGGARGAVTVSQVHAGRKNCLRFEIAGSKGSLAWNSERPNELWLGHRDRANELLLRDPALLHAAVRPFANYPGGHNEGFPDSFKQLFRAVYDYVQRSDFRSVPTFPTFADGHHTIRICQAISTSHRVRQWVRV